MPRSDCNTMLASNMATLNGTILFALGIFHCFEQTGYWRPGGRSRKETSRWQILVNVVANHRWRLTRKSFLGGSAPHDWSAAVAASEGQEGPLVIALVGRCRGLLRPVFGVMSKISTSSQGDLGQGPACSAFFMERSLLTSLCLESMTNAGP